MSAMETSSDAKVATATPMDSGADSSTEVYEVVVKWNANQYELKLPQHSTIGMSQASM